MDSAFRRDIQGEVGYDMPGWIPTRSIVAEKKKKNNNNDILKMETGEFILKVS